MPPHFAVIFSPHWSLVRRLVVARQADPEINYATHRVNENSLTERRCLKAPHLPCDAPIDLWRRSCLVWKFAVSGEDTATA